MSQIDALLKMLQSGQDTPLLRFGLGNALFKEQQYQQACEHLAAAVVQDPNYSAAWKLYAKALTESGRREEAIQAYERGIEIAQAKGDLQAAKEMNVFLKRLQKTR
jgi:tetratricopeptide (TPR) repeat protein